MLLKPLSLSILLSLPAVSYADAQQNAEDFAAVTNFMLSKDYPELFSDKSYHIKIEDMLVADVLNDGTHDVVIHVTPNYRQSATILIYAIAKDRSVTRVTEGLAPGPLVPITGDFLDSHTLGEAVDMTAGAKQHDPVARQAVISSGLKNMGGLVAYKNFFHADGRHGPSWFIDMSDIDSPIEGDDCSKFEFSTVGSVAAGRIDGAGDQNYLVVQVGKQLYVYLLTGLKDKTFLNKKVWIEPIPQDFSKFVAGNLSPLSYETTNGVKKVLSLPEVNKG